MDSSTRRLVEMSLDTHFSDLGENVVHQAKRRLIDSFACALGSFDHPLSVTARELASHYSGTLNADIWGAGAACSAEMAAFANGVMVRVGENSDTFIGKGGGGHPSDMLSGIVATAQAVGASGRDLIAASVSAYDAYCNLMEIASLGDKGFDQVIHVALGTVLGAGKLMGLSREQLGHAVSLALTPNVALRETRHGQLSNWKGAAGANAARNAVFAAILAKRGVEGPGAPFEGKQGLWSVAGRFEWPSLASFRANRMIANTSLKCLPVCYHTQAGALGAMELRSRLQLDQIQEIQVETYQSAYDMAAGERGQWAPHTPESADHSLPFVVATALVHGEPQARHFLLERLDDPAVMRLVAKVTVKVDTALSALWPETAPARVTVHTTSGSMTSEIIYPKGHVSNPMSDAEVGAKFTTMFGSRVGANASSGDRALAALWNIDASMNLEADVFSTLTLTAE